jgi:hypothetical protein
MLGFVHIADRDDEIVWGLPSTKNFTTSSLYMFLTSSGISSRMSKKKSKSAKSLSRLGSSYGRPFRIDCKLLNN